MSLKYKVGDKVKVGIDCNEIPEGSIVKISKLYLIDNKNQAHYSIIDPITKETSWTNDDEIDHEATKILNKKDNKPEPKKGGSLRYNEGKPEFSHLSPQFILEMMKTMTKANEKYPYLNYTKRQDVKTASDSLMRHYLKFQLGDDLDEESECHHLAHLAVNAMIIFQNLYDFGDEVDNRYEVVKKKVQDES